MKSILWDNIARLMVARWGKENLTRLSREAKFGPATASRLKAQETSVGIEVLEAVASVFRVEPWHLLVNGLDPARLPQLISSDEDKQAYSIGRSAVEAAKHPHQ